jgi:tetratricopeptide (TPR) repeat protein
MLYLTHKSHAQTPELERPLMAADGFLFLGMPEQALEELAKIPSDYHQHSSVLRARIRILLHLRQWKRAEKLSRLGSRLYPDENEFMVQRAFSLHQQAKGPEAIEVIRSAPEWIRRTGILQYNLACYEAQLGDLGIARQCIRAAIEINSSFKKNAKTDPDLQRLWN